MRERPRTKAPLTRKPTPASPAGVLLQRQPDESAASNSAPAQNVEQGFAHDFSTVRAHAEDGAGRDRREREADSVAVKSVNAPASEQGVRQHVGQSLGFDFSNVRLHRDASHVEAQNAHAVASGADVYLAPGRYRPDLPLGRALLAHELTHVAQQAAAPRVSITSGIFRKALEQTSMPSSDQLRERAATLGDATTELTPAPLGMQQRCVAGCKSCSEEQEAKPSTQPAQQQPQTQASTPQPTHSVGPDAAAAGNKVVRLAWTVDDGPTPLTPGMSAKLSPRAATWFIMSNQLGTDATARSNSIKQLVSRQKAGDEIGIHSMHPTVGHSAWFPISLGKSDKPSVPKGYNTTQEAMNDLKSFTGELRTAGLNVRFGRMPGGEYSELKKYVEQAGGSSSISDSATRALLSGTTPPEGTPAVVTTDVALVMSTLKTLNLHLWGGSASGAEVTSNTWEAESSGVPAERTDDVVRKFTNIVNALAGGTRTKPGSFIILAHDTTKEDVTKAGENIAAMEDYATGKGVRVEYYRMADLYQIVRGTAP